jgi:hypothetical protein
MGSKQRGDVEGALASLLDLTASDPNNVPVLLALAHGFMLLKQAPKVPRVSGPQAGGRLGEGDCTALSSGVAAPCCTVLS